MTKYCLSLGLSNYYIDLDELITGILVYFLKSPWPHFCVRWLLLCSLIMFDNAQIKKHYPTYTMVIYNKNND